MKKNLTELVFILDRSGSMAGLEADTIGGFNAMIEKHRRFLGRRLRHADGNRRLYRRGVLRRPGGTETAVSGETTGGFAEGSAAA